LEDYSQTVILKMTDKLEADDKIDDVKSVDRKGEASKADDNINNHSTTVNQDPVLNETTERFSKTMYIGEVNDQDTDGRTKLHRAVERMKISQALELLSIHTNICV